MVNIKEIAHYGRGFHIAKQTMIFGGLTKKSLK